MGTPGQGAVRVVVVDDEADLRVLVRRALERRGGFDIVGEAGDARTALEVAAAQQPDVVVLDLGLPDLAGGEVITQLRELVPQVRIVVFTGSDPAEVGAGIRERGAFALAEKRRDVGYLVDVVREVAAHSVRRASLPLALDPRSAGDGRRFVTERAAEWGWADMVDELALVVTELVANAVVHAQSKCVLRMEARPEVMRIEVSDEGTGSPNPKAYDADSEHGRGLLLVSAISTAWGVHGTPSGSKVVWAELALTPASASH